MSYLLKEALKSLCGVNQWSYAVFWKIGCQNPKLLIWEDCYYRTTASNAELPFEGWAECSETHTSQLGVQAENKVSLLINRMMMSNLINIVGEGMVGRAAFTGNPQWILSENYLRDANPPEEVLNEVRHQYSSGMQTVVVIPVLPHGVVQIGSPLAMVENMGFVNDVRSLIFQLGNIPGALLSDKYTADEPSQKIGIPIALGAPVSADLSGNFKMTNSSFISNSRNQQSNSSQSSRLIGETSDSVERQSQKYTQTTASTFQTHKLTQNLVKPHNNHHQSDVIPVIKRSNSSISQLENGFTGAILTPPSLDAWKKLQASSYNPGSGFNNQSGVGQSHASYSSLGLIEQQIMADSDLQDHVSSSGSLVTSLPRTTGVLNSSIPKNSVSTPLFRGREYNNSMTSHLRTNSVPSSFSNPLRSADVSLSSTHLAGFELQNANSLKPDTDPMSKLADHLTTGHMFAGGSNRVRHLTDHNHSNFEEASRKQKLENDLFQALNSKLTIPDVRTCVSEHVPGSFHGYTVHKSGNQSSRDNIFDDASVQRPSGDDLFDIFGVDFKSKLFNGNQNSFIDGPDGDKRNVIKDSSTSTFPQDACPDVSSSIEEISESIVFSGIGSDHLLDAVVSKVHLAAKLSSSDNVSCKTTLSKVSGCSVPSTSHTFNRISMSNPIPGEAFGLPKPLGKAGMVESSSFRSGCSKDDAGNCSQTSTIYGSQISSWVEQGPNMKHDSSVSTAYSKRPDEISKSNRKRLKPGENPRPRPKDRQMIQDRVKELREIVPNGAKCSIDALLERTIKHMLFLQSVTKHADKLKQTGESKIVSKEGGLLLKDNFEGGATWAFEVGSNSMVCPIIVEDLNPPRQMLVEMLCEERGFFLEIADIIRGLGLTILKGVMEVRNDKIWARFVVEANRDVTRMEIFMSLVRLLEQTMKSSAALVPGIDNDNMMGLHQSFHQTPCIPATDRRLGSLQ